MSSDDFAKVDAALRRLELEVRELRVTVSASGTYGASVALDPTPTVSSPVGATR